ncbi:mechanosensitive ion channel domain-containing protein [Pseudomonas sp. JH-2]|uniref:mechanosensitive ion channel family protein n=1 Tax=unclassified Pseudomonas TaxID=196821 RepID=UPI000D7017D8|nr:MULTISPECIES: mechanosensitive ion channel domain-containing protein [unclassified Pseudomonas]MED5611711.1 mechanosensitive ion channel domain-containing protein [Pseudomonas sp. JH-2]PWU31411.1 mechanosensitive ion channel protein MscS [Pseudomonas sp. RW407]
MDMNYDQIVRSAEAWTPLVLSYLGNAVLALITLLIGWWLINLLTRRVGGLLASQRVDKTLQGFIGSLVNIVLKILLVVSVASMIGIQTTSFVAAIGAAGLAIGLALQGSLSNFAGGVLILLFRPFKVGDAIEAQGVAGTVDSIQIFHTVLRTGDNRTVIMPNGALSNGIITNVSSQATRQVIFDIKLAFDADLDAARGILLELAQDPRVLKTPAPVVVVSALGENSVTLSLRLWTANADFGAVTFMLNEQVRLCLRDRGIDLALPSRVVRVVRGSEEEAFAE